jgi:type IV pilus assembly protein PilQ
VRELTTWAGTGLLLALAVAPVRSAEPEPEARVSLDVKDGSVTDIVRVLSETAGFQVVFDPGVSCKLTLKLRQVPWRTALDESLKACRLSSEAEGDVLRVAPSSRFIAEADAERRLKEARAAAPPNRLLTFRLSYARAQEIAPLVKEILAPRGDVVYDARTNTLIIVE